MKGVIQGYKNAVLRTNPIIEEEAQRRLSICENCPFMKKTIHIKRCNLCGCPLSALTRQNYKICKKWQK